MLEGRFHRPLIVGVLLILSTKLLAAEIKFARYPHSSHGKIAFTYHGDIWTANLDGSDPIRLTDHEAMDLFPRFSPDGKWIAFNSNRMGNSDIWLIPSDGGEARQLTFHTASDNIQYWTPDGKGVVISTSRGAHPWGSPLYIVPLDGKIPYAMDMDRGSAGMISQDGSKVAFNRNSVTYWRKHYKGNNQTDIWVQDLRSKKFTQLTDTNIEEFRTHVQDAYPMWGADGKIYFLSERDGYFNIWRIAADGSALEQVTHHNHDGVQYPAMSPDGTTITYENEFELWRLPVPDGTPQKIIIELAFDVKKNMVEYLGAENSADGFYPSPQGDYLAVDFHGEIFIVPAESGVGELQQVTSSAWRDRYEVWSPDGAYVAYVSDESLEEEVWLYEIKTGRRQKVSESESTKGEVVWSADSKQLAYVADNTIVLYDLATVKSRNVAHNAAGGYSLQEFSRDGKWLVLNRRDADENSDVYLLELSSGTEYNISQNPFRDSGGALSDDGRYLIFTSSRDNAINHLFIVSLRKTIENINDPLVKERLKAEQAESKKTKEAGRKESHAITLDMEGIKKRALQLTRGENGAGAYFLPTGEDKIYYVSSDEKGPGLFSIDFDGKNQQRLAEGSFSGLIPSADGKMVFYRQQNDIHRMTLSSKKKEQIRFNFRVKVDRRAEWEQVFEEAWRVMKYRFYDENMHGFDWGAVKSKYKPFLAYVGENQDLYDLTNEMIGELNASHTGVSGPSGIDIPSTYSTRSPGFELEPDMGSYRISHIYRDGPADKEWIDLKVGDYLHAINGIEISAGDNYWVILNHLLNDFVTVTVSSSAKGGGDRRDIRIETVNSLRDIKYEEWVTNCREFVERETDGEIAYVHIRSMNQTSLRRFENEIDQYWNKKGIIVDIRYNGGGNIDEPLLDILERRPYSFVNRRGGAPTWGRRHRQAIAGPKVMLINHRSFSDAEMTPAGFRVLGLGRLVGTPTGGGVIWTGSYRVLNGASIRTPGSLAVTYDTTQPNKYGINLENYGVAPDIFVENTPEDELRGYDRELKAAIEEVRRMLSDEK